MKIILLLFSLFFLSFTTLFAQRFSFIQFSTSNGLPQSQVNSITQDSLGYLWIGTYGGLARFDGTNFRKYGKANGLLNNRITKLQIIDNRLYVGHPQGISIKNANSNRFFSYGFEDKQIMEDVSGIFKIKDIIYVATNGAGLFELDKTTKSLLPIKDSPSRIRDIIQYGNQSILATRIGLFLFDGEEFLPFIDSQEFSFSGLGSYNQEFYATSFNGVLFHINPETREIHSLLESTDHLFRNILIDNNRYKWINSSDGVTLIKNEEIIIFTEELGLPTNDINVVFQDSEENIWMGTNGKGIIRFTDEVFTYYSEKSGFPSDLTIAIEIDKRNNKWISTIDQGVFIKNPSGKIEHIDFITNSVWQIRSTDDFVLFASNFGLYYYDYKNWKSFYVEDGLPSDRIIGIHSIDDTNFLVSTLSGGIFFDKFSKKLVQKEHPLTKIESIRDLKINNNIYYAASNNSIFIIDENKETNTQFDAGVSCIEFDDKNTLWIGTENGLYTLKDDILKPFLLHKNGALESVNFMQKYDSLIFVGTNNGLFEIGSSQKHQYHYGINSGLIDLETNLNSNYLEKNRWLWFGTASGLMKMDLDLRYSLLKDYAPKLQLISITINNKDINQSILKQYNTNSKDTILTVRYSDKNINFKFDGIYMTNPKSLRYSYFIEGFSSDWTIPNRLSEASFTNLPWGNYTFHFKAENGVGQSELFTLPIKILPPFYFTWWFYLLIVFILLTIIFFIEKVRATRQRQKNYRMRLEFQNKLTKLEQQSLNASMNRHFIFNSLNSIQYYINSSDTKSANKFLSRFAKLIRKNLDSSYNEDGMVLLADEIERLKLYLELESMRFQDRFDYTIYIEKHVEPEFLKVPAMFLQPFVENSIIHGILPLKDKKGKIEIAVTDHLDHIRIKIEDNGIGIDNSRAKKAKNIDPEHQSQGMLITKNRIELLQKFSERSISMIGPHQINENDSSINGTVVVFKILKQYLG